MPESLLLLPLRLTLQVVDDGPREACRAVGFFPICVSMMIHHRERRFVQSMLRCPDQLLHLHPRDNQRSTDPNKIRGAVD